MLVGYYKSFVSRYMTANQVFIAGDENVKRDI